MILKKSIRLILPILIFIGVMLFYIVWHPLYIYDTDDWCYISFSRGIFPSVSEWNPSRILPEILMPLTARFGVTLFMPIINDYIQSMSVAFAIVISFFITLYVISSKAILVKFKISNYSLSFLFVLIFLMSHYIIFKNNEYFFFAGSVTLVFYYTISLLLNAVIVFNIFVLEKEEKELESLNLKSGVLWLCIYFCINSNMFESIVLTSYIGAQLFVGLIISIKRNKVDANLISCFLYTNKCKIFIVFYWLFTLLLESRGGRATSISSDKLLIGEAFQSFLVSISIIDQKFIYLIGFLLIIAGLIVIHAFYLKEPCYDEKLLIKMLCIEFLALFITVLYLLLVSAKAGTQYMQATRVMSSWLFYLMLITFTCSAYILKKIRLLSALLPFVLCAVFVYAVSGNVRFKDNIFVDYSVKTIKALDDFFIAQIVEAENAGLDYVEVKVPKYDSIDGWPLGGYYSNKLSKALYKHGVIDNEVEIKFIYDKEVNSKFMLHD